MFNAINCAPVITCDQSLHGYNTKTSISHFDKIMSSQYDSIGSRLTIIMNYPPATNHMHMILHDGVTNIFRMPPQYILQTQSGRINLI